ncbi:hypothetical protein SBOR_0837 [Sclerotinia borealis F-4128]|uniref:Aflatoxin regulatory protein domain-containing protein n=1 Tax=Sclerotinia borealis (strain F-4128) TaxID=1432307 RepID=W9CRT7_SCLBF|nr:hypothetical protein SBOR_0837 [Sclerotinia borealis F-4128]
MMDVDNTSVNRDIQCVDDLSAFDPFGMPIDGDNFSLFSPSRSYWAMGVDPEVGLNMHLHIPNDSGTLDTQIYDNSTKAGTGSSSASNSIWNAEGTSSATTPASTFHFKPPRSQLHDCEAKGLPPFILFTAARFYTRTAPTVAISTVKEILECACAQQQHVALLCMTISTKALYWYRLAGSPQYQASMTPDSPNHSSSNSGRPSIPSVLSSRGVESIPIQIGVFDLEEENQRLLIRGVLLREVRKLEGIVEKMQMLSDEHRRDDDTADGYRVSNWSGITWPLMKAEVQDTLQQIKEFGACGTTDWNDKYNAYVVNLVICLQIMEHDL